MALSNNPAVRKAYKDGTYTDKQGQLWRRGMDGWFFDISPDSVLLARHDEFVKNVIEKENPVEEGDL